MRRRGLLLSEMLVAFLLMFLAALSMMNLLSSSDTNYRQAAQSQIALRLARQGLENVRAKNLPRTAGTQTLTPLSEGSGRTNITFSPSIIVTAAGTMMQVRSRVTWIDQKRTHNVELVTLVAP